MVGQAIAGALLSRGAFEKRMILISAQRVLQSWFIYPNSNQKRRVYLSLSTLYQRSFRGKPPARAAWTVGEGER